MTYHELIADFCQRIGIDDPAGVADGASFPVDGFQVSFCHDEDHLPRSFALVIDLGQPSINAAELYRELLARNFQLIGRLGGTYAVEPESATVIFSIAGHLDLDDGLSMVESLMQALEETRTLLSMAAR